MAGELIGDAVIGVSADSSQFTAGIAQATQEIRQFANTAANVGAQAAATLGTAQTQAAAAATGLTAAQQRLLNQLNNYSQSVGRTRGEVLELRAAQLGLTTTAQAQIAAIRTAETATRAAAEAARENARALEQQERAQRAAERAARQGGQQLNQYGQTAKGAAAALRQVPAQFTDIIVSLQGGQAPLTVLLQQGGQLKDVFGGIVPAAKALGGFIVGLINPVTILGAGVAALGVAYFQGSREVDAFNKSLLLSGNIAGKTAGQLQAQAASVAAGVGTQAQAAEVIAKLVGTGQVFGNQYTGIATSIIRANKSLGLGVDDLVKNFAELGKDPVRASERLNEQYRYLTLAVYDQIRALEEQGKTQQAAELAQKTFADAMTARANRMQDSLGTVERAWRALTSTAKDAWDAMLGIGRNQTPEGAADAARQELANRLARGPLNANTAGSFDKGNDRLRQQISDLGEVERLNKRSATSEGERAQQIERQVEARKRLNQQEDATRSPAQRRQKEIDQLKRDAQEVGMAQEEVNKRIELINDKYRDRAVKKQAAFQDDAGTKMLQNLRETEASLREQASATEKLTAAEKERAKFTQLVADLKDKKVLTADQKSLLANESAIKAQLDINVSVAETVRLKEAQAKAEKQALDDLKQYQQAVEAINISIAQSAQNRAEGDDRTLGAFGRGNQAREQVEAQKAIVREYARYQEQLNKTAAKEGQLGSQGYADDVAKIQSSLATALAANENYYMRLRQMQGDWQNGTNRALENYAETSANVADQIESVFTDAFKGMEDVLVTFITTGKLSFTDLAASVAAGVTRMIVATQITGPLASALQGSMSGGSGGGGFGGILSTGLSWLFGGGAPSVGSSGWGMDLINRAVGGGVNAGQAYQVTENAPELLSVGGKQFLMMGNQSGNVTPMGSGGASGIRDITVNVPVNGNVDNATRSQIGQTVGAEIRRALARNS